MADEYPWLKEFINLIDWGRTRWGGTIIPGFSDRYNGPGFSFNVGGVLASSPANFDDDEELQDIHGLDSYPAYETTVDDIPVAMGFSGTDIWHISLQYRLKWKILVRHEHWADRMFKNLKLDYEFQTGNPEFDKTYYLRARDKSYRPIFLETRFQDFIRRLEPFGELAATVTGISVSRKIDTSALLQPSAVEAYIKLLFLMARYLKA
jgi:hypothetical protein